MRWTDESHVHGSLRILSHWPHIAYTVSWEFDQFKLTLNYRFSLFLFSANNLVLCGQCPRWHCRPCTHQNGEQTWRFCKLLRKSQLRTMGLIWLPFSWISWRCVQIASMRWKGVNCQILAPLNCLCFSDRTPVNALWCHTCSTSGFRFQSGLLRNYGKRSHHWMCLFGWCHTSGQNF